MDGGQGTAGGGGAAPIAPPARIGVHDLGQARAVRVWAAYRHRPVVLYGLDAEAAGVGFWRAVELQVGAPLVVMCGPHAATVLAALRVGLRWIAHGVVGPQAAALNGLLSAHGARREQRPPHLCLAAGEAVARQLARFAVVHGDQWHPSCYEAAVSMPPDQPRNPPCD